MLQTYNNKITIKRLVETSWEKTYTKTVASLVWVYIEPIKDEVWIMTDWQGAFNVFKMFSDYAVVWWDKIIDENGTEYKVKWVRKYESILWTHYESIINSVYD
jgi:hypothetical protein